MKRNAIRDLIEWKNRKFRQPLFLYGIKGCGKTYLAMDFAKSFFEGILYVNLEQNTSLRASLESGIKAFPNFSLHETEFLQVLSKTFDAPEEYLSSFLIVLDEFMASPSVAQMLFQLAEEELPVCLLAITSHGLRKKTGKMQLLKLFPLQFDEYLQAIGSEWYAEVIKGHYQTNHKIPMIVHNELLELFEGYLMIGGMPAALNEYLMFESADNIVEIHKNLFAALVYSIEENYEEGVALRMKQVLDAVPLQLAKKNQKFQYSLIRKGATFSLYRQAIQALLEDSILIQSTKLQSTKEEENNSFKLFPPDVGMYCSATNQELQDGLKKDLLDCYVVQALAARGYSLAFWESNSQAHIDIVLQKEEGAIPVEIRTHDNTRSKSITIYQNEFHSPYSIKISNRNFELSSQIKCIPYYAVFCL